MTDVTDDLLAPVADAADDLLAPVTNTADDLLAPVTDAADDLLAPVLDEAGALVGPVVAPVTGTLAPIVDSVAPVFAGLDQALSPVGGLVAPLTGSLPRLDVDLGVDFPGPHAGSAVPTSGPVVNDRGVAALKDPPVSSSPTGMGLGSPTLSPTPADSGSSVHGPQLRRRNWQRGRIHAAMGRRPVRAFCCCRHRGCACWWRWVVAAPGGWRFGACAVAGGEFGCGFGGWVWVWFQFFVCSSCFSGGVCRFPLWPAFAFGAGFVAAGGFCGRHRAAWLALSGSIRSAWVLCAPGPIAR